MQGDYNKSKEDCLEVVDLNPYHFGAWHGLGLCEANLGHYPEAIRAFREALDIQPHALVNQRLILECTALLD
jgi:tetratricopeptide (TPR) repeat protein